MTTSRTPGRAFLSGLYFIYQWLVYIPLVALATLVGGIAAIIVALLISPRAANLGVGVMWGRVLAWLAPVRVDMEGLENIDPDKSYVVVANHQSQFDIPVRSEEHTSELQSRGHLVCRLLLEKQN